MPKVPRVRERTATPEELAEEQRRYLAAKPRQFATVEAFEDFVEAELHATHGKNGRPELPAVEEPPAKPQPSIEIDVHGASVDFSMLNFPEPTEVRQ